jgi:membrane protein implicated in regulation of membrane protease activity
VVVVGCGLVSIGFGTVFLLPNNSNLLLPALVSGLFGFVLIVTMAISYISKTRSESGRRIKNKNQMTVLDAARIGIGMPVWWRWWFGLIPFVVILLVVYSLFSVSPVLNFVIFFGYSGIWSLVVLVAARRALTKPPRMEHRMGKNATR